MQTLCKHALFHAKTQNNPKTQTLNFLLNEPKTLKPSRRFLPLEQTKKITRILIIQKPVLKQIRIPKRLTKIRLIIKLFKNITINTNEII